MKWSCGHEGHLNLDWLKRNNYSSKTLEKGRRDSALFLFAKQVHKLQSKHRVLYNNNLLITDSVFCSDLNVCEFPSNLFLYYEA